ncbi:hypothetical protein HDU98_007382, partial [Podochytrium sp. JEL0797]
MNGIPTASPDEATPRSSKNFSQEVKISGLSKREVKERMEELLARIHELETENGLLNDMESFEATKSQWAAQEQTLLSTIKSLKVDLKTAKSHLAKQSQESEGTHIFVDELKLANRGLEAKVEELTDQVTVLQNTISSLKQTAFCQTQAQSHLQKKYDELEAESKQPL